MKTEDQNRSRRGLLLLSLTALCAALSLGGADAAEAAAPVPGFAPAQMSEAELEAKIEVISQGLDDCLAKDMLPDTRDEWQSYYCRPLTAEERANAEAANAAQAAAEAAAARAALPPVTIEAGDFLDNTEPDYRVVELCRQLGGQVQSAEGDKSICSGIDEADTFCIVGDAEAFPCRGLFKHVLLCNNYNRKAKNPFLCAPKCASGTACGDECFAGGRFAAPGRIPYVAGSYAGEVVRVSADLFVAQASVSPPHAGVFARAAEGSAAVGLTTPLAAGAKAVVTVRGDFSCAGLSNPAHYSAGAAAVLTITALTPPTLAEQTYYFEAGDPQPVSLRLPDNLRDIPGLVVDKNPFVGDADLLIDAGKVKIRSRNLPAGTILSAEARATAPGLLGTLSFPVRAEIHRSFSPVFDYCRFRGSARIANPALAEALYQRNEPESCRFLRQGADPNAKDPFLGFPLHIAARHDWVVAGEALLANEARTTASDDMVGNALNHAARHGAARFARWLLTLDAVSIHANAHSGGEYQLQAPLHALAARNADDDGDAAAVVRELLAHGGDPNLNTDGISRNYLHLLTDDRGPNAPPPDAAPLRPLLRAGLLARTPDDYAAIPGLRPLSKAVWHNYAEIVAILLEDDGVWAMVNRANADAARTFPLHYARSPTMVSLLLAHGARPNAQASDERTPLDALIFHYLHPAAGTVWERDRPGLTLAIAHLRDRGDGLCFTSWAEPESAAARLCARTSEATGAAAATAECEPPTAQPGSAAYVAECRLRCAGADGGAWRCEGSAESLRQTGTARDETLRRIQTFCEARTPGESGLSCPAE